jgi:hypothetical protein
MENILARKNRRMTLSSLLYGSLCLVAVLLLVFYSFFFALTSAHYIFTLMLSGAWIEKM